jgi:acyl-CoA reductase-like NAD-dependent aldehyde dehydrogenase
LELGGKDGAYVAPDANLDAAIETLVDGAFYNAGQSCCGVGMNEQLCNLDAHSVVVPHCILIALHTCALERIYVHHTLYDKFVDGAVALVKQYKLGDPLDSTTSLGPIAQPYALPAALDLDAMLV